MNTIEYNGYRIHEYYPEKKVNMHNSISGHRWTETVQTSDKPYYVVDGPMFNITIEHDSVDDAKASVDYTIKFGKKYYNWTDTDRTGHQIKKAKRSK